MIIRNPEVKLLFKKGSKACGDFEIIDCKPLFLFSLNSKTNLRIKLSFIFIVNFAISVSWKYRKFLLCLVFGIIRILITNFRKTSIPVTYCCRENLGCKKQAKSLEQKRKRKNDAKHFTRQVVGRDYKFVVTVWRKLFTPS